MWLKPKEAEKHLMSDLPDSNTPVIFNISQTSLLHVQSLTLTAKFRCHLSSCQVMETWVQQSGFPRVTVTRQYGDNTARVEQTRCGIIVTFTYLE